MPDDTPKSPPPAQVDEEARESVDPTLPVDAERPEEPGDANGQPV